MAMYLLALLMCVLVAGTQAGNVAILVDVSGSVKGYTDSVENFLQPLVQFTSTDAMFDKYPITITVFPFDSVLHSHDVFFLSDEEFDSAAAVRNTNPGDKVSDFVAELRSLEPMGLTNMGAVLESLFRMYGPRTGHVVIVISDFMNRNNNPDLGEALLKFKNSGAHVFPVLMDKDIRDERAFETFRNATTDKLGLDLRTEQYSDELLLKWFSGQTEKSELYW